jgi:hypothetical protein
MRAGPVFAGTSAMAGEGTLVTANADMAGGGGWKEAADGASAIAAAADNDDANRGRDRRGERGSCSESQLRSSSNKRRALDSAIDGRQRTSCSRRGGGSSKDIM